MIYLQYEDMLSIYHSRANELAISNVPVRILSVKFTQLCRLNAIALQLREQTGIQFNNIPEAILYGMTHNYFTTEAGEEFNTLNFSAPDDIGVSVPENMLLSETAENTIYVFNQMRIVSPVSNYTPVNCDYNSTGTIFY